jgi:hypothetical protein
MKKDKHNPINKWQISLFQVRANNMIHLKPFSAVIYSSQAILTYQGEEHYLAFRSFLNLNLRDDHCVVRPSMYGL